MILGAAFAIPAIYLLANDLAFNPVLVEQIRAITGGTWMDVTASITMVVIAVIVTIGTPSTAPARPGSTGDPQRRRRPPPPECRFPQGSPAGGVASVDQDGRMTSLQEPASARWRELLDADGPILADGAMGTMLFAAGLQFGDPPEVWNLDPARTSSAGSTAATSTPARGSC